MQNPDQRKELPVCVCVTEKELPVCVCHRKRIVCVCDICLRFSPFSVSIEVERGGEDLQL